MKNKKLKTRKNKEVLENQEKIGENDNNNTKENEIKKVRPTIQELKEKYGKFVKLNLYKKDDGNEDVVYIKGYNEKVEPPKVYVFRNGNKKREIIGMDELEKILSNHSDELLKRNKEDLEEGILDKMKDIEKKKSEKDLEKNSNLENKSIIKKENKENQQEEVVAEKKLRELVDRAREKYVKGDYTTTNVFAKIRKILGKNLRSSADNLIDVKEAKAEYEQNLANLLAYQIKKIRDKKLTEEELNKEIDELTKYYYQDEKINLYESHTKVRAEAWENKLGKKSGWAIEKSKQYVNWYRKLNWKKKISLSVAITLTGAGFLMIGQRVLGGAAAGVGASVGLEAWQRKKEEKNLATDTEGIKRTVEMESEVEEKYKVLMEFLEAKIAGYGDDLQNEKAKAIKRKLVGAMVGIFIGSGAASHLVHWGVDKVENTEVVKTAKTFWVNLYNQHFGHSLETISTVSKDVSKETIKHAGKHAGKHVGNVTGVESHAQNIPDHHYNHSVDASKVSMSDKPTLNSSHLKGANAGLHENYGGKVTDSVSADHAQNIPDHHYNHSVDASNTRTADYLMKAQKGDSVWKIIGKQLEGHYGKTFNNLNPAQKTYVIDVMKDKIAQNPAGFGLKNIDKIKIGQKFDFTKLLENKADVAKVFEQAKHLSSSQLKDIAHNNEAILDWVGNHHGQVLNSAKIEDILHQQTSNAPVGQPVSASHAQNIPDHHYNHSVDASKVSMSDKPTLNSSHLKGANAGPHENYGGKVTDSVSAGGAATTIGGTKIMKNRLERKKGAKIEKDLESKIVKKYEFAQEDDFSSRAKKVMQKVSLKSVENWKIMKDVKLSELDKSQLSVKLKRNIKKLEKDMFDWQGKEVKTKKNETLKSWLARIIENSLK